MLGSGWRHRRVYCHDTLATLGAISRRNGFHSALSLRRARYGIVTVMMAGSVQSEYIAA
jgi:hypothetical protein